MEVLREGVDATDIFGSLLIDDPDDDLPLTSGGGSSSSGGGAGGQEGAAAGARAATPAPAPTGLQAFMQHVQAEVVAQLQEEALA